MKQKRHTHTQHKTKAKPRPVESTEKAGRVSGAAKLFFDKIAREVAENLLSSFLNNIYIYIFFKTYLPVCATTFYQAPQEQH